jgi:subtilase family serine protease
MAPMATIYLVEAQSNDLNDLLCAVAVASDLVAQAGGGEVSMSWGTFEFPGEILLDSTFDTPQVVYLAASGDGPGVSWPSSSPNVVSVGGTTLNTNAMTGEVELESSWEGTGGGESAYEPSPSFQNSIASVAGQYRATPDISAVANPYTGVWVLDTLSEGSTWYIVGGTSVPTALMAGIVNAASSFFDSSAAELGAMYRHFCDFEDVKVGSCGLYLGTFATAGWDFCTGLGSPRGYAGK